MLFNYFCISWRYIYNGWVVQWLGARSTFVGLQVQIQARTEIFFGTKERGSNNIVHNDFN